MEQSLNKPNADVEENLLSQEVTQPVAETEDVVGGSALPPQPPTNKGNNKNKRKAKGKGKEPIQVDGKRPKSGVWTHFKPPTIVSDFVHTTNCIFCNRLYRCHPKVNGTSSLKNHMGEGKCPGKPPGDSKQKQLTFNSVDGLQGFPMPWSFNQSECRTALAQMVILDEQPFRIVENEGFKRLMSKCCPMFKLPSRHTVHRDVISLYVGEKEQLKGSLTIGSPRVSLTTDTWTSNQQINYMCLTAHYIDENWILNKKILNFCPISTHKGEDIGKSVEKCLNEWGINRVMCMTMDNASSNATAVVYLIKKMATWPSSVLGSKFLHMRCIAHVINLIVKEGLTELGDSVEKVRAAIRYIRHSPQRVKKFKDCVEAEKIETKQFLCLDVPTRWNSTYLMLCSASNLERAFERYQEADPFISIELKKKIDNKVVTEIVGMPNYEDWVVVNKLITFLHHFYELTNRVSGSQYVTANIHLKAISDTYKVIDNAAMGDDLQLRSIAENMMGKYKKYWGKVDDMNCLIYVAPVFDPRLKLEFVTYVIDKIYDYDVAQRLKNTVIAALNDLFKCYKDMFNVVSSVSASTSINSARSSMSASDSVNSVDGVESEFKMFKSNRHGKPKSELDRYLKEEFPEGEEVNFSILDWWRINSARYPVMSKMARDILSIPISTVSSESAFSTGGRVLDDFRSSMTPATVQALICCQDWMRSARRTMTIEEDLKELHQIEEEMLKRIGMETNPSQPNPSQVPQL